MSRSTDFEWISKHYSELQEKYPNMYVAVKDGEVLAADREYGKARDLASKSSSNFVTAYILSGEPFVLAPLIQHSPNKV
ncbi:MAG: hypothetical protein HY619_02070 [Thaumarchaeota archaeon]|nr:hypothetical protein [Nitrososphaerota archaeon]